MYFIYKYIGERNRGWFHFWRVGVGGDDEVIPTHPVGDYVYKKLRRRGGGGEGILEISTEEGIR